MFSNEDLSKIKNEKQMELHAQQLAKQKATSEKERLISLLCSYIQDFPNSANKMGLSAKKYISVEYKSFLKINYKKERYVTGWKLLVLRTDEHCGPDSESDDLVYIVDTDGNLYKYYSYFIGHQDYTTHWHKDSDFSNEMPRFSSQLYPIQDLNLELTKGDLRHIPLSEENMRILFVAALKADILHYHFY